MAAKKKTIEKVNKTRKAHVSKTVQQSIPYIRVYDDANMTGGVIEVEENRFTKMYAIPDTNFSDAGDEKQEEILTQFEKILTSFNPNYSYEISVFNRTIDQNVFNKKVLMAYKEDGHDDIRTCHNEIVLDKMQEGKNNLTSEKYLTIGLSATDIRDALNKFKALEKDLLFKFKKIYNNSGASIEPCSLRTRLGLLHDIYNINKVGEFDRIYNLQDIVSQGITTKDIIGPSYFDFKKDDRIKIGDTWARVLFLKSVPTILSSTFIESLSSISTNILVSVHYEAQSKDKAIAFASAQVTNVGGEVVKAQKNLSKAGASPDLISPRLETAQADSKELLAALTNGDQTLMHITLTAVVFANNEDDLDLYTNQVKTRAKEYGCTLDILGTMQEQGLNTSLPLAENFIYTKRIMTNYSASAIQPFSTQELQYEGGFYYGLNQLSKNLIVYNRSASHNQNAVILGIPGAGKSFAAKMEMYQAHLNSENTQIFIIDPEREYQPLGIYFNATTIYIQPGGEAHINPLDLDISKDKDDKEANPFAQKVDYVMALVETMLGSNVSLNGYARGIIDRALREIYKDYLDYLRETGKTIDTDRCPTLVDLYQNLIGQREPEAKNLAKQIEIFCVGTLDLFAHKTNIDTSAKMVIYDTKEIGINLQELGMQICLNDIWNRTISNKKRGVYTWSYIDEFYLLLKQPSSANYLQMMWKRSRKWWGRLIGITQNVGDLLETTQGETILQTSDFVIMLTQAPLDRIKLARIYNIPEEQLSYITNADFGEGLIRTNRTIIPFENHIPTDTLIYKLLTTKAGEGITVSEKVS